MTPLTSVTLGAFNLYSIETGRFKLDGGSMFGVVPKTLWSKKIEPDSKNRITMAMRCLLIESRSSGRIYLVDNGTGNKFSEKFQKIYGIDHDHSNLIDSLKHHGFAPEDITDLILTHLHFDHCGGTTYYDEGGNLKHQFPNAQYHVTNRQLNNALQPNAREKASILSENVNPIAESIQLNTIKDDSTHEYEPGLTNLIVDGHSVGQQLVKLEAEGTQIVFAADLLPTVAHIPMPWVMAFDMQPLATLSEKQHFFNKAVNENWFFFMEHDASHELITIKKEDSGFALDRNLTLEELKNN